MEKFKEDFINFLLKTGALKLGGDYPLKSQRTSPWFVNIGDFNDGKSTQALGDFYADAVINSRLSLEGDDALLYGIPEKGVALAVATAEGMARKNHNVPWFFTRKMPKEYGESANLTQAERVKASVVGRAPKNGQSIIQLDDVFTTGDAKYEAQGLLKSLGDFKFPLLAIAVDRQEVGADGNRAITEYEQKTGTKVVSVVNAMEVYQFLMKNAPVKTPTREISKKDVERVANYLRVYGIDDARKFFGKFPEQTIIQRERSVIPACDVSTLEELEKIVVATSDNEKIGAYKVGFELGLGYGLPAVVGTIRKHSNKPIIYDHQKAGTDILQTGLNFARVCKKSGVDAVILFPQEGPETERAWIYHALDAGLKVIVGGRMTHPAYAKSEGGFITDEGAMNMYRIAARIGINNFVVPGNKPEVITQIRKVIEEEEGVKNAGYNAPGFIGKQGGKIEVAAKVAGNRWNAIVGTGIYAAPDMKQAALEVTSQI